MSVVLAVVSELEIIKAQKYNSIVVKLSTVKQTIHILYIYQKASQIIETKVINIYLYI